MTRRDQDGWIVALRPRARAAARLFCFPYAGGHAQLFRTWARVLPDNIDVCAIQLPGRMERIREPPLSRMSEIISGLAPRLVGAFDLPVVFFGHSLGALISFEVARWLQTHRSLVPAHLVVSGRRAPHMPAESIDPCIGQDDRLLEELRALRGTPAEALNDAELMGVLLPMIRADFAVAASYRHVAGPTLSCPLTAFGGNSDPETHGERLTQWSAQTSGNFRTRVYQGDHWFLHTDERRVIEDVGGTVSRIIGRPPR